MATRNHPDVPFEAYFITAVTHKRKPVFSNPSAAELLLDELRNLRTQLGFLVLAYVVMPDHVHLVVVPGEDHRLASIMQHVKGRFARRWNASNGVVGSVWQSRYDETAIVDEVSLARHIEYVEENPVVAGLADDIGAYPFSSGSRQDGDLEMYYSGIWHELPG